MASKGRNRNQDWDPMQDDYNDSLYDAQYPDDNSGGGVQLDQCRLYITNIPTTLNEDGLNNVFRKFGTLKNVFLSRDARKRYALITYSTPGEAKLAMMKLNRAEPLNMNICISHKSKYDRKMKETREPAYNHGYWDDNTSQSGSGHYIRNKEDYQTTINGDCDIDNLVDIDSGLVDNLDPELHMELVELKMESLKLQQAQLQCKQRMLLLNRAGKKQVPLAGANRQILPDGQIVLRNANNRANETLRGENHGADGDANHPPSLLRISSRACVSCGSRAEFFCSRCEVTPYCSARCQKRDWAVRHRCVCHNLARLSTADLKDTTVSPTDDVTVIDTVASPPPLRPPHCTTNQNAERNQKARNEDDRQHKFTAANHRGGPQSTRGRGAFSNKNIRPLNNQQQDIPQNNNQKFQNKQKFNKMRQPHGYEEAGTEEEWAMDDTPKSDSPQHYAPMRKPHTMKNKTKLKPDAKKPETDVKPQSEIKPVSDVKPAASESGLNKNRLEPATLDSVTPSKKIAPKKCIAELLSTGDTAMLSVESSAIDCRAGTTGYVCLSLNERYSESYEALCEAYAAYCEADKEVYKPIPGQSFSYLDQTDGGWYRARCLGPSTCALLDAGRLVTIKPEDTLRRLPQEYADVPEFCCVLRVDNVKIGDNLKCVVKSKLPNGCEVAIENAETSAPMGVSEISRWLPEVEYAVPAPIGGVAIPEVPRPQLVDGSLVFLVEAADPARALVRGIEPNSQRKYDSALHGVILYGQGACPLSAPPQKGELVVGKFTDGLHYRALCKRTNVKQDKYLLEYIEFGSLEIAKMQDIYPCPPEFDLNSIPAEASVVSLKCGVTTLNAAATEYLDGLKDSVQLTLKLCSGAKAESSGAQVILTNSDTKECVNRKLEELCTPEWKKMERNGGDVVETPALMYSNLQYLDLPAGGCEIEVLDISSLEAATVSGYKVGEPLAKKILEELPKQLEAYCKSNLGREPYLPKFEELCVAQCPPYDQWFRAVLCEQVSGAGGNEARVCYVDYGNVECVRVGTLRKMMPEFVKDLPALAVNMEIRDFPKEPTNLMLAKALQYMNINDEGKGRLIVKKCEKVEEGVYIVDAPDLIKAMLG